MVATAPLSAAPSSPVTSSSTLVGPPPPGLASSRALHLASITALVAAPILIVLPPRKLDLYTLALGGLWATSAEHQIRQRSGVGVLQWLAGTRKSLPAAVSLAPDEVAAIAPYLELRTDVNPRASKARATRVDAWAYPGAQLGYDGRTRELLRKQARAEVIEGTSLQAVQGVVDWKLQRLLEERAADQAGMGVGDRILAQIWSVWNQAHHESDLAAKEAAARDAYN